ncbi:MAG: hypothetical protein IJP31_01440 [Lachnospiraceae bacterium]|nr:hypothetical protein [Lachnospiraceae bacterium]
MKKLTSKLKINETMMLALVMGITLIIMVLLKTFLAAAILIRLNIPNLAGLSLLSLLLTHYLGEKKSSHPVMNLVFAALIFGCLPWLAGLASVKEALWLAGVGGVEYTLISGMFASMTDRMECTIRSRLAPVCSAFVLFMAFQGFGNILL